MNISSRAIDLTGVKKGRLTVLGFAYKHKKNIYWKCECECGKIMYRSTSNVREAKSCGCLVREGGRSHKNWKGCGDLSSSFVSKYREQAKRRSISFAVTTKYLWLIFKKQEGKCALSGQTLKLPIKSTDVHNGSATASLDRIDSTKGYQKDNVQWVHKDINFMKQQFDEAYFVELCRMVVNHKG